jgi:transcription elongation factor GreA-like protein
MNAKKLSRGYSNWSQTVLNIWEKYITLVYDRLNRSDSPEFETEEKYTQKRRHIKMEKVIKRVMDKKAAGDENVSLSRDILKILEEGNLEITTRMINNVRETGESLHVSSSRKHAVFSAKHWRGN